MHPSWYALLDLTITFLIGCWRTCRTHIYSSVDPLSLLSTPASIPWPLCGESTFLKFKNSLYILITLTIALGGEQPIPLWNEHDGTADGDKPKILLYSLNLQFKGIQVTATTPSMRAVRFETGLIELELSNLLQTKASPGSSSYLKLFGKCQVDLNLALGQIVKHQPKMIEDIWSQSTVMSYVGCLTQMSLFLIFICLDDMILTVMAYDRFVAICHPMRYYSIMNHHLCGFFIVVSFLFSLLIFQLHNLIALHFTYFKDAEIANFFCDPSQLLNLVCSDTITKNVVMYFVGAISGFLPLSGIFYSYYKIASFILRIPSSEGKYKAFSTCESHLSVVCLFYGTAIGVYFATAVSNSPQNSAVSSLMYTVFTPMLNPFIYSLRNNDIKCALKRLQSTTT
ncbi:Olfactory receptor 18 [Heterocephalus glaber]|uniref:Olfactory receptor 18 n=1 Tax=Heterocephalus glaber TaxID=10181 RepID=G5C6N8_HETGA|nr:Olfactory receptor 18 [Heterocephalus glaber]